MELKLNRRINAPAATVWGLLAEKFGDVGQWTSGLAGSHMTGEPGVGAVRTCTMPNGDEIQETLVIYSPEKMNFKYTATQGLPSWLKEASNNWAVHPINAQTCTVSAIATVVLPWWLVPVSPLAKLGLKIMGKRFLDEMEYYLANGSIHPRAAKQKTALSASG